RPERLLRGTRRTGRAPRPPGRSVGGPTSIGETRFPLKYLWWDDTTSRGGHRSNAHGGKPYVGFRGTGRGGTSGLATTAELQGWRAKSSLRTVIGTIRSACFVCSPLMIISSTSIHYSTILV